MTLEEFLAETRHEVLAQVADGQPYAELVFCEVVMQHLQEAGMTFEPELCHYDGKIGNGRFRLSGHAISEEGDHLDLFVSLYGDFEEVTAVPDSDTKMAALQCVRFLDLCASGKLQGRIDPSHDVNSLVMSIHGIYNDLETVRIFVLTDGLARSKSFKSREISGKLVSLEVMDIERLYRHRSEGKPRDEIVVNFKNVVGTPLPCVHVPSGDGDYAYALTAVPGEALRFIYEKYGQRLLEANVRSFLSVKAKGVNAGIQETLQKSPDRFMAYNNGIVLVADEMRLERAEDGSPGILWLRGMQIVNGGQTTASIYFAKKKHPSVDLAKVRVPAKIIIMNGEDAIAEEELIASISRYANSQNAVRQSDLSANKPFHVDVERLAMTVYCPDGVGRWFYERAAGSYNTLLAREATPAKRKALKDSMPSSRKITKTDLAKYLMAWDGRPDIVSLGTQKCFDRFMRELAEEEANGRYQQPDTTFFKELVAKALIFKAVHRASRPRVTAFLANVTAYTVSVLARSYGRNLDLEKVWQKQGVSTQLMHQIAIWASEVDQRLKETSGGRMISEWAKRAECREKVFEHPFSPPSVEVPEYRRG